MILLYITGMYLAVGLIFTIPFLLKGIERIDEGVGGAPVSFRILLIPGCMVFWPILLKKYVTVRNSDQHD